MVYFSRNNKRRKRMIKSKLLRTIRIVLVLVALAVTGSAIFIRWGNDMARVFESDEPSRSIGSTKNGSLVNGKRLPTAGPNFRAYGYLPIALGRNSLHIRVRHTVLSAFTALEECCPKTTFIYGECSWPGGGRLRPHATHRNGLSIDFMVPVTSAAPVCCRTRRSPERQAGIF